MTDTEDRLLSDLNDHVRQTFDDWEMNTDAWQHRVQSPVEPCSQCGHKVFLILCAGYDTPYWYRLGEADFTASPPRAPTVLHECGDGDSWSVEAALFVESAMASWGLGGGPDAA